MSYLGEIASLATAVCWAFTSIFFTRASRKIGALQVNLYRLPAAVLLLTIAYLFTGNSFAAAGEPVFWLGISGVVGLAVGDTFLFQAMSLIGARLSMVLMALVPPITAVLAFFFLDESISFTAILGIAVTVGGVIWVVAERTPDPAGVRRRISAKGILQGFLGALGQAVGLILAKKGLRGDIHFLLATLVRMLSATLIIWPVALLTRTARSPLVLFRNNAVTLREMGGGIIFGPFLGVTLSLIAVKFTAAGIAATLMSTVPVIMIPLLMIIEKEIPSWRANLGAVIAVAGIAILFLR
ncbi:MAG: DMT family transporter [Calditrichia bacterium]